MIRLGPAGVPLSCKGRNLHDGIDDVHALGLHAMEIQLVRGPATDELEDFPELGDIARTLDIEMGVHTPYYMDLLGSDYMRERTLDFIIFAGEAGTELNAKYLVTHIGPYHDLTSREAMEELVSCFRELRNEFYHRRFSPKLAVELTGRRDIFGSLREVTELCQRVHGLAPVINWPHLHARGNRWLTDRESFKLVFEHFQDKLGLKHFYTHYSGVEFDTDGQERHYAPVKKGEVKFEQLAEVVLENDYNVTFISDSPLMEHDAMYMKIILERVEARREERIARREAAERIKEARRAAAA